MTEIVIDIDDWCKLLSEQLEGRKIDSKEAILDLLADGLRTSGVSKMAQAARALGLSPADVLPPPKFLLIRGGAYVIGKWARDAKQMEDGHTVSRFIGVPQGGLAEGEESFVVWENSKAQRRIRNMVLAVLPRHIRPRLIEWHVKGGDVAELVDELKDVLDHMVDEIVSKPEEKEEPNKPKEETSWIRALLGK